MSQPSVKCDQCGKAYRWRADLAGKQARCKCGAVVAFPAAEEPEPIDLSTGEFDVPDSSLEPLPEPMSSRGLDLSDDAPAASGHRGKAPPPVSPLMELAATGNSQRASDAFTLDDSPQRVIGERSSAYDEPEAPRKSPWKSIAFAAAGVIVTVGLILLFAGGGSGPAMPESAGGQSHTFDGVKFLSFDDQTNLDLLNFHSRKTVDVGGRAYIQANRALHLIRLPPTAPRAAMWTTCHDNRV